MARPEREPKPGGQIRKTTVAGSHISGASLLRGQHRQRHNGGRDNDSHKHFHAAQKPKHRHSHDDAPAAEAKQMEVVELRRREASSDSPTLVTEIVQTISVIQYINGDGSIVDVKTLYSPLKTQVVDASVGLTLPTSLPSGILPPASTTATAKAPPLLSGLVPTAGATEGFSNSSITETAQAASAPLTTARLGTGNPHLPADNGTSSPLFNNATHHTLFANSTRSASSSVSLFNSSTFSSSVRPTWSANPSTTTATTVSVTGDSDGGGTAGATAATAAASSEAASDSNGNSSTGPPTSTLVGSVVGGVAGIALILLVAMLLLRWKRRGGRMGHLLLGEGGPEASATRGVGSGGDNGGSGGGGANGTNAGPAARRTTFLMPFAALANPKRLSRGVAGSSAGAAEAGVAAAATGSGEKGFYRVSGKKLPSVLQHGGDGYEDPRISLMSSTDSQHGSVMFRDSLGFFGGAGGPNTGSTSRFAVGSPMRPESGVPIVHAGPHKTPTIQTPVSPHGPSMYEDMRPPMMSAAAAATIAAASTSTLTLPRSSIASTQDPMGRSLTSNNGSRASISRFTETIP